MPGVQGEWRPVRLVCLFIASSLPSGWAEASFAAYRLRLAHGSQPPADPFSTVGNWQVNEIVFMEDAACQLALTPKKAIASAGASKAPLVFDGNRLSQWRDECVAGEDAIDQCKVSFTGGAWVGAELESASDVQCILIDLGAPVDGLLLDGWSPLDGKWIALQEFVRVPKSDGTPVQLRRLRGGACGDPIVDNVNLGIQVRIPTCVSGSQWRFTAIQATRSWAVFELELHKDLACRDAAPDFVSITSDDNPETARRLHDGLLSTAWTASCTEGAGKGPCDKNQLWVGMNFPRSEDIACIRVFQTHEAVGEGAGAFSLSMWDGTAWVANQNFSSVNNGLWSYLSPQIQAKSSQWRLVNNVKTNSAWAVHELAFMRDSMCSQRISGGLPLSSTIDGSKAFDDNTDTVWVSQCAPCEPSRAHLGQRFEFPVMVRCVHLWQGGDTDYMPQSVALELWDNTTTNIFTWRQIRVFSRLVEGLNQLSPWWGASGTRFRVANLDEAPGGWRVAELRLFSDIDCFERVTGMGFSIDKDPADADRALDGDVSTFWHASCCPKLSTDTQCLGCDGIGGWVGLISIENTTVKCLQIIQKGDRQPLGDMKFAAVGISLQGWDGSAYQTIYEWYNLPGDDWVELAVGVDHNKDSISCKDNRDWELCNVTGFNCSRYREEDMCNETFQDDLGCGGVKMSFACKESCCLCGAANVGHCPTEAQEDAQFPIWFIPVVAGLGGLMCTSSMLCCILWRRRSCHHRACCHRICHCLDKLLHRCNKQSAIADG